MPHQLAAPHRVFSCLKSALLTECGFIFGNIENMLASPRIKCDHSKEFGDSGRANHDESNMLDYLSTYRGGHAYMFQMPRCDLNLSVDMQNQKVRLRGKPRQPVLYQ